jgi:hypothetical protein
MKLLHDNSNHLWIHNITDIFLKLLNINDRTIANPIPYRLPQVLGIDLPTPK